MQRVSHLTLFDVVIEGDTFMEKMLDLITGEVTKAFIACGYDEKYARVTI